jgi:threonyl-tRNA synthetase
VRAFTQDDAHLYLCPEQIEDEVKRTVRMFREIYDVFGFKAKVALSTRPGERMGEEALWDQAEAALESALRQMGVEFEVRPGEGAFYGPKIDFQIEDCLGREWQCGTCQLDFQLPEKFGLTYVGQDGRQHRPVIIHPAAMGSIERFMALCIEDFEGRLPTWMSPVQALILPVSDKAMDYAGRVLEDLTRAGARAEIDTSSVPLGKRIRNAHLRRVPYMLIVGPKEAGAETVSVRDRLEREQRGVSLSLFVERLRGEVSSRRREPAAADEFAQ